VSDETGLLRVLWPPTVSIQMKSIELQRKAKPTDEQQRRDQAKVVKLVN
jgi:hypothetical protein